MNKSMLVAFLGLAGAHRGSGVEQEPCQPLTALQLEVPSSQWDDSVGIKPSPLTMGSGACHGNSQLEGHLT